MIIIIVIDRHQTTLRKSLPQCDTYGIRAQSSRLTALTQSQKRVTEKDIGNKKKTKKIDICSIVKMQNKKNDDYDKTWKNGIRPHVANLLKPPLTGFPQMEKKQRIRIPPSETSRENRMQGKRGDVQAELRESMKVMKKGSRITHIEDHGCKTYGHFIPVS